MYYKLKSYVCDGFGSPVVNDERRTIIYGQVSNKDLSPTLIDFKLTRFTIVIVPNELKKMTLKICWKVKLIYIFLIKVVTKEPEQGILYYACWVQVGLKGIILYQGQSTFSKDTYHYKVGKKYGLGFGVCLIPFQNSGLDPFLICHFRTMPSCCSDSMFAI